MRSIGMRFLVGCERKERRGEWREGRVCGIPGLLVVGCG